MVRRASTTTAGTPYAADVQWALGAGLAAGCDPTLFCTYNATLRDELAVFMSRLLQLPATTQDLYDDDDGSRFETYNNRVGAAGIMSGCGVRRFCPTVRVSRALAAVTLARALDLPASSTDHFTDDDGTGSEPYINAVADAGLIPRCGDRPASARPRQSCAARWRATCGAGSDRSGRWPPRMVWVTGLGGAL